MPAPAMLPWTRPRHRVVDLWLAAREAPAKPLGAQGLARQNLHVRALTHEGWPSGRFDLLSLQFPPSRIRHRLAERVEKLQEAAAQGKRVLPDGTPARARAARLASAMSDLRHVAELRLVRQDTELRCFPDAAPIYEKAWGRSYFRQGSPGGAARR